MDMHLEFSRTVELDRVLATGGGQESLTAGEAERIALARRLGLLKFARFEAVLELRPWRNCGLAVSGQFEAEIAQACVVTLEPLESTLKGSIEGYFLPGAMLLRDGPDKDMDEPPEEVPESGLIDLGELAVQHLAVAIDPYPRRRDADFVLPAESTPAPEPSPFAVLAALKGSLKG